MPVEIIRDTTPGDPKEVGTGVIHIAYKQLRISFSSPRGFGDERYTAIIEPDQFAYMARTMMKANPDEAIKAFGEALKRGIPEPVEVMKRWSPQWEDEKLSASQPSAVSAPT